MSTLWRFDVQSGDYGTLMTSNRPPYYALGDGFGLRPEARVAIYTENDDDTYSITLANDDLSDPLPFVTEADDLGDPYWHPTGKRLTAVYADGRGAERAVFLAWIEGDGTVYGEWSSPDYVDLQSVHWSPDADKLILFGFRRDQTRYDAVLVDIASGTSVVLRRDLAFMPKVQFTPRNAAYVNLLWKDTSDRWGFSGYAPDGTLVFEGIAPSNTTGLHRGSAFYAADTDRIALKIAGDSGEMLLAGRYRSRDFEIIARDLTGLGNPVWQSANTLFFTQSENRDPIVERTVQLEP